MAIAELQGTGLPVAVDGTAVSATCRPLLTLDGQPLPVRALGAPADARLGLALEPCDGPVALEEGTHTVASRVGLDEGFDVDRLILSSAADGTPASIEARGAPRSGAGAEVDVQGEDRGTDYDLAVRTDGEPFWLVLGQSDNRGWSLGVDGATVGERQIVDGYANGWLITPDGPGDLAISVTWGPQRLVWLSLVLSAMAVVVCIVLIVGSRRRPGRDPGDDAPPAFAQPSPGWAPLTPGAPGLAVAVGVVVLLVATPLAAVVASASVLVGLLVPRATWAWLVAAPGLVLAARWLDRPELAWVALALVLADLTVERWSARSVRARRGPGRGSAPAG